MSESARAPAATNDRPKLKRVMGPGLLLLFVVGDILGTGVYALTGKVAGEVGGAVWLPFLCAFVVAMLTATSYLGLVTKYPEAGCRRLHAQGVRDPLPHTLGGDPVTTLLAFLLIGYADLAALGGTTAFVLCVYLAGPLSGRAKQDYKIAGYLMIIGVGLWALTWLLNKDEFKRKSDFDPSHLDHGGPVN